MKILIGLGNPGQKYENTRHNVGFMMIEGVRKSGDFEMWKDSRFEAVISEGSLLGEKIILMKPLTFMNLSGKSVEGIVNFYKLDPKNDILILSDDLDMDFAKVRYRPKGSHGGQNGLRDIIEKLGNDEFARIKIGIGRHEHMTVVDWVLSKFSQEEQTILEENVLPEVEKKIEEWLR